MSCTVSVAVVRALQTSRLRPPRDWLQGGGGGDDDAGESSDEEEAPRKGAAKPRKSRAKKSGGDKGGKRARNIFIDDAAEEDDVSDAFLTQIMAASLGHTSSLHVVLTSASPCKR